MTTASSTSGDAKKADYWFPAKTYGWGWGFPTCWQGGVVLASFVILMVVNAILFPPPVHLVAFLVTTAVLGALLIAICFAKGEPPAWRWGK